MIERETASNWQNNSVRIEENDDLEDLEEEEEQQENQDVNVSTSAPDSPIQPVRQVQTQAQPSVPSVPAKRTSAVTGRIPFSKNKKKAELDLETDLMLQLKERISSKKDEDDLYGQLLAAKLKRMSRINRLKAKHEIDNLMFKFQLEEEGKENNIPLTLQHTSSQPIFEASSPIYQPQNQIMSPKALPDISHFRSHIQQQQQQPHYSHSHQSTNTHTNLARFHKFLLQT